MKRSNQSSTLRKIGDLIDPRLPWKLRYRRFERESNVSNDPGDENVCTGIALAGASLATTLLVKPLFAQDAPPPRYTVCDRVLNSLVEQLKKHTEAGTYGAFDDDVLKPALIGVRCSSDQIEQFMKKAGWIFSRSDSGNFSNRFYRSDLFLKFYIPDQSWISLLSGRTERGGAYIHLYEGKITSFSLVPAK